MRSLFARIAPRKRDDIRRIVHACDAENPGVIRYFENDLNLGYDGNLRNLVDKAAGEYCFFMGNDDLMCPGALETVASALDRFKNIGVVLRSYASFNDEPSNIDQVFRYFPVETLFPSGPLAVATFFRRCVVIPGLVMHRDSAARYRTEQFDGTLLYQLHLVANILIDKDGLSLPEILVKYRNGGHPDFGNSEKEKGKYVPGEQTPDSSLHFVRGMLSIASWVEKSRGITVYERIVKDIGNYSYPILSIQAERPLLVFLRYAIGLWRMGLWKSGMFVVYMLTILVLGKKRVDRLIVRVKNRQGYTPVIGAVYRGARS